MFYDMDVFNSTTEISLQLEGHRHYKGQTIVESKVHTKVKTLSAFASNILYLKLYNNWIRVCVSC